MKTLLFSTVIFLAPKAFSAGYGAAGCGLGSLIFTENNEWWAQSLAMTTNGVFGNQSFAITFGTSNCDSNAMIQVMDKTKVFIEANLNEVSNDIARGNGETVQTLAGILGCEDNTDFSQNLKSNYSTIFADSNAANITKEILFSLDNSSCQPNS